MKSYDILYHQNIEKEKQLRLLSSNKYDCR